MGKVIVKVIFIVSLIPASLLFNSCTPNQEKRSEPSSINASRIQRNEVRSWIELGPSRKWIMRAVVSGGTSCPKVGMDGVLTQMSLRAAPSEIFPVTVCEIEIPSNTIKIEMNGTVFHTPNPDPKRIVVMGDTGCRITSIQHQGCNSPERWPFKKNTDHASLWKPDLVIHVGDYYYREVSCPDNQPFCSGSPFGDTWDTWRADFFLPAENLLATAPWIFVRGNHEDCSRGGNGWFRFLDPRPFSPGCQAFTPPYIIDFDHLHFVVFDSAHADDGDQSPQTLNHFLKDASMLKGRISDHSWFLSHHPVFLNSILRQVIDKNVLASIELLISGHYHLFEAYNFRGRNPGQLIVGNGGAALTSEKDTAKKVDQLGEKPVLASSLVKFGYLAFELERPFSWKIEVHGIDNDILQKCFYRDEKFSCHGLLDADSERGPAFSKRLQTSTRLRKQTHK